MKIRLSEYEEGVADGREESAEIMRLKQSEIEALTAHIKNLTKGTIRQQQAEILAGKIMIKGYSKTIDEQQAEIEVLKKQCALLQEGYNAQAILLGVETGLTPDFFFMENDLMGKR